MSGRGGSILVVDVGTSGVRAAIVRPDATVDARAPGSPPARLARPRAWSSSTPHAWPMPFWTWRGRRSRTVVRSPASASPTNGRRASSGNAPPASPWHQASVGRICAPSAPASSLQSEGIRLAPNASATKVMAILDDVDPERVAGRAGRALLRDRRQLGGLDTVGRGRSGRRGAARDRRHQRRRDGARRPRALSGTRPLLEKLRIPLPMMPAVVDSSGSVGEGHGAAGCAPDLRHRRRPAGLPRRTGLHVARAWPRPPSAPAECSTSASGRATRPPAWAAATPAPFPIVAFRVGGGRPGAPRRSCSQRAPPSNGSATTSGSSRRRRSPRPWRPSARRRATSGSCPALLGLGTPVWDFGAAGTLVGLTRGSGRPEIVRAVLEGVAHRGADLVEASEQDSGFPIAALRVDGGMTDNDVFVQALADAIGRPVRDLARAGGHHTGGRAPGRAGRRRTTATTDELAGPSRPGATVEPAGRRRRNAAVSRDRWLAARRKAEGTIPELSGISF